MTKHIKILGKGNSSILIDKDAIANFLKDIILKVKMTPLGEPVIYDVPLNSDSLNNDSFMDEGGLTGVILLTTSHCAIHTWPLKKEFHLDIYSCKEFNKEVTVKFVSDFFQCYQIKVSDLTTTVDW
jgi:S-adenosylmethionine decarboxylase